MLKTKASQPFCLFWSLFIPARKVIPFSAENESRITETTILPGTGKEVTQLLPELLLIYFFPNEPFITFNTVFYINNKAVILKQNKKTK